MRILIHSYAFSPSLGGIETVSAALASEFQEAGHEVRLITNTPGPDSTSHPFPVLRQPTWRQLHAESRWCDLLWQNNVSLRLLGPHRLTRKPTFITAQTWIYPPQGRPGIRGRIKGLLHKPSRLIAISRAVAKHFRQPATIIGNPYSQDFGPRDTVPRTQDIAFVGRLVSDKGVDVLLQALHLRARHNHRPNLTIIGDGPERAKLEQLTKDLALEQQVTFLGRMQGEALVKQLNRHKVLAVPSRWQEPFGVVALEGAACGCTVIGSREGGLADAIGPCGLTFENGDHEDLARQLDKVLGDSPWAPDRGACKRHLDAFTAQAIGRRYLELFAGTH